ncbi:MAG TPA: sensor histidine kinase, partial [Phnomibacter sp.]|nr:sensor histidine kinase [Phnomibacter sp.]
SHGRIWISLFMGWMAGLRGGVTVAGMGAAIKLMKYWYVKEQRNQELQQQNTMAQLELLKAQVHPHFLFNTLNNIYSLAQEKAPDAANMIMGLGNMLRYMLYETSYPQVPLYKEIELLKNYMGLEQSRYGNQLEVQFRVIGNPYRWRIAPLLMLPLVENCFKHGASQMIDHPWISFELNIGPEGACHLKLVNGQDPGQKKKKRPGGIGLSNLEHRLELLYPSHKMECIDADDLFVVDLHLQLIPDLSDTMNTSTTGEEEMYETTSKTDQMPARG